MSDPVKRVKALEDEIQNLHSDVTPPSFPNISFVKGKYKEALEKLEIVQALVK